MPARDLALARSAVQAPYCGRLPLALQRKIQDFLWGQPDDWKQKLGIVRLLGTRGYHTLRDVTSYISYSNYIESEDSLYLSLIHI